MGARSSPGAGERIHAAVAYPGPGARAAKLCRVKTRARSVATVLLGLFLVPWALAGCGGGDAAESSSATLAAASTPATEPTGNVATAEDGATEPSAFPANTEPDLSDPSSDAAVTVRDIRLGRQEGF